MKTSCLSNTMNRMLQKLSLLDPILYGNNSLINGTISSYASGFNDETPFMLVASKKNSRHTWLYALIDVMSFANDGVNKHSNVVNSETNDISL